MARKNEKIVLEDVELKPQVIGHIYEKKTNIGRVLLIFICFGLVVFYINDISVYINNLLGKKSATTIEERVKEEKNNNSERKTNVMYYEISDNLTLIIDNLTFTHFNFSNNILSYDIFNYTENDIDLNNKKIYLETYDEDKNLIEVKDVEVEIINAKNKVNSTTELTKEFKYIKIAEK